jgi:hypothetical protein
VRRKSERMTPPRSDSSLVGESDSARGEAPKRRATVMEHTEEADDGKVRV